MNQWQEWNRQGFIPGPDETETAFIERVEFCQQLKVNLPLKIGADLPFENDEIASESLLKEVFPLTDRLYGIQPQWVPLFFSNYQLAPWHGGCAWIFQLDEKTPTAAFLQLRAHFRHFATYLGLYHRKELIAHELAHVGRMLYQEPQFEELFAYQTSTSRWRRWLGPLVQSSKESLFFILILGAMILADIALLTTHASSAFAVIGWIKIIPLLLIAFALGRLMHRHYLFRKCFENLRVLYPQSHDAQHVLYRLRDSEIKQFACLTPSKIGNFIKEAEKDSFRWRFLNSIYLLD